MPSPANAAVSPVLGLTVATAADLMTPNPVSLRAAASVPEAIALLIDKGVSAAPVIDAAGHPVGVLSTSDILAHERERAATSAGATPSSNRKDRPSGQDGAAVPEAQADEAAPPCVRDLMTPVVFSVAPETPSHQVIGEMLALRVHHLFVVDKDGVLIGVISAFDVLRHLQPI
jgi:CBS domain-containing protein